nr:MAG TPA: S25 ribosomal protein [Caudoviricetes sp.]
MFYLESYKIMMYKRHPEIVEAFDYYLGTLVGETVNRISASDVADKLQINIALAKQMLREYENKGILKKRYLGVCPNEGCDNYLFIADEEDLLEKMEEYNYCDECDDYNLKFSDDDIYLIFERIKKSTASQREIEETLVKKSVISKDIIGNINFFDSADSLAFNSHEMFSIYYSPNESAYTELKQMKKWLNGPFKTTKEKGDTLEEFALYLFKQIKAVSGTNRIKTYTNQFDCTVRFPQSSKIFPTIMRCMTPYFIIECKNETEKNGDGKTPSNTYFHKLSDIMATNDAQLGIVISRGKASEEDIRIAHDNYLVNRNSNRQRIMLSISDEDIEALVDEQVNLLDYLSYKMDCLTMNAKNATFDMFKEHMNEIE